MSTDTTAVHRAVVCPSCGEVYDSELRVREVLRNSGYCVNLTCLEDLSAEPLDEVFGRRQETRVRERRRRA